MKTPPSKAHRIDANTIFRLPDNGHYRAGFVGEAGFYTLGSLGYWAQWHDPVNPRMQSMPLSQRFVYVERKRRRF